MVRYLVKSVGTTLTLGTSAYTNGAAKLPSHYTALYRPN